MFNEPFLTFISKLPPAKSIGQCGPNFTDGAVDCQPMERWKDDIVHWHWVLIWFLFNGFCHVQRVSEKQSTIFIHFSWKTQSSPKKLHDWPSTIPFLCTLSDTPRLADEKYPGILAPRWILLWSWLALEFLRCCRCASRNEIQNLVADLCSLLYIHLGKSVAWSLKAYLALFNLVGFCSCNSLK